MSEETPTLSPTTPRPTDTTPDLMADILNKRKPNEKSCHILLDPTIKREIQELETALNKAIEAEHRENRKGKGLASSTSKAITGIQDQLTEVYERMEAVTQEFIFRDIGNKAYDEGLNAEENRPTPEQKQQWKEAGMDKEIGPLAYHTENFPVWLISETSYSPKITRTQARQIFNDWSEGDLELLFHTAIAVCKERTSIPFGKRDFVKTPDSDLKSLSAEMPESPTLNSLDGEKTTD